MIIFIRRHFPLAVLSIFILISVGCSSADSSLSFPFTDGYSSLYANLFSHSDYSRQSDESERQLYSSSYCGYWSYPPDLDGLLKFPQWDKQLYDIVKAKINNGQDNPKIYAPNEAILAREFGAHFKLIDSTDEEDFSHCSENYFSYVYLINQQQFTSDLASGKYPSWSSFGATKIRNYFLSGIPGGDASLNDHAYIPSSVINDINCEIDAAGGWSAYESANGTPDFVLAEIAYLNSRIELTWFFSHSADELLPKILENNNMTEHPKYPDIYYRSQYYPGINPDSPIMYQIVWTQDGYLFAADIPNGIFDDFMEIREQTMIQRII